MGLRLARGQFVGCRIKSVEYVYRNERGDTLAVARHTVVFPASARSMTSAR